jgi:hypothetical protein
MARGILHIVGQAPAAHQQAAELRLEFAHEIGEGLCINHGTLPALEAGKNF